MADRYTKIVLTIIAVCLVALVARELTLVEPARALDSLRCDGELRANSWGATEKTIGGYRVEITCR
jgi:hypothetical protein